MDPSVFDYLILPLLIFSARIVDVSLDTIRVIMVSKGYRTLAPVAGFFQVLIWIITITRIMENLDNWVTYLAYASGFGFGTYVGMVLEAKLALGSELIRIITKHDATVLTSALREKGFMVTTTKGMGRDGEVGILFLVIKRKSLDNAIDIVKKHNPNAFYTIEDMRYVRDTEFPTAANRNLWRKFRSR